MHIHTIVVCRGALWPCEHHGSCHSWYNEYELVNSGHL